MLLEASGKYSVRGRFKPSRNSSSSSTCSKSGSACTRSNRFAGLICDPRPFGPCFLPSMRHPARPFLDSGEGSVLAVRPQFAGRNQKNRSIFRLSTFWLCIAIGTAVLATTIGIEAVIERNVGAVVVGNDGPALVRQKMRGHAHRVGERFARVALLQVGFDVNLFEAIRRVDPRAAADGSRQTWIEWALIESSRWRRHGRGSTDIARIDVTVQMYSIGRCEARPAWRPSIAPAG